MMSGTPAKSKRRAEAVLDEEAEVARDQVAVVDADRKTRRRRLVLRDVVDLQLLASLARHRALFGHGGEGPVQGPRRDVGSIASLQIGNYLQQVLETTPGASRHGQRLRTLAQLVGDHGVEVGTGSAQVGLVHSQHRGAAALGGLAGDLQVELAEADRGVDHDHGDVGAVETGETAQIGVVLDA